MSHLPTPAELESLHARASDARAQAYSPFSRLQVGAAVLTERGSTFFGCNVECASFGATGCAEQHAIAAAVLSEGPSMRIAAVAVSARNAAGVDLPVPPCGACRQRIAEFGSAARVIFRDGSGSLKAMSIAELLPAVFELQPAG